MDDDYAYGMWIIALFNIGLFLFFILSFIRPKGRVEWRNMGIVTAFLAALFTEMYGFPLTIYLLTGWLGEAYPVLQPFSHKYGHLWVVVFGGSNLVWALIMGVSVLLLIMGYILMSKGWRQIHAAQGKLVTTGVYAFVRHPQYTGLFLLIIAFLIQWPTLLTVIMAPILIYAYVQLSRAEESAIQGGFSDAYQNYRNRTPMFFPKLKEWPDFIRAPVSS